MEWAAHNPTATKTVGVPFLEKATDIYPTPRAVVEEEEAITSVEPEGLTR